MEPHVGIEPTFPDYKTGVLAIEPMRHLKLDPREGVEPPSQTFVAFAPVPPDVRLYGRS
jgi:hypothetical protein